MIYAHLGPEFRNTFHKNVVKALKPEGKLILEAFHPKQLKEDYESGGPKNLEMLYSLETLKNDFKDLSIIKGQELEIDLTEGKYHQGKAFVTRFTGVK